MKQRFKTFHGDCLDVMSRQSENSVDSVVCDPPYGLSFMGKHWDHGIPGPVFWQQALRVAKPGAHLLAFGGTRTFHRLACAIEDAGWEIRDCLMWVYGSGFPKSRAIDKAIDAEGGGDGMPENDRKAFAAELRDKREAAGVSRQELALWFPKYTEVTKNWERQDAGFRIPSEPDYQILVERLGVSESWRLRVRAEDKRRLVSEELQDRREDDTVLGLGHSGKKWEPTTEAAQQWAGWGTALKPAWEPVLLARKPFASTVAANVLKHGTGAINVDGCRVGSEQRTWKGMSQKQPEVGTFRDDNWVPKDIENSAAGRWPANFIHDGSDEVTALLGDAARFFYCAKASRKDRGDGNSHPTVKPCDLMRYLCRLVTPPNGIILDPFMGSGSTGKAAILEGFRFVGIEKEAEYFGKSNQRLLEAQAAFLAKGVR